MEGHHQAPNSQLLQSVQTHFVFLADAALLAVGLGQLHLESVPPNSMEHVLMKKSLQCNLLSLHKGL